MLLLRRFFRILELALLLNAVVCAQTPGPAVLTHISTVNGRIEGSVQLRTGESATIGGTAVVTGNLYAPGLPTVTAASGTSYGGTVDGAGAATPAGYNIVLTSGASLRNVVRRTDPVALPTVTAPPTPSGTRNVAISATGQSVGDFTTLRNLTLTGTAGMITVPPGTYGNLSANGASGFVLGVAGATTPAVYNLQNLSINPLLQGSQLQVVGPVVLTVANTVAIFGATGAPAHPEWLTLQVSGGGLTINGNTTFSGDVIAPTGTVTINANSTLIGRVQADRLAVNAGGTLRLAELANQNPTVTLTAPASGTAYPTPASFNLIASASDPDGTIAKVEFYQGATFLGNSTVTPYQFAVSNLTATGNYTYTARAYDNLGATGNSPPVTITVTPPNQPPAVTLLAPPAGSTLVSNSSIAFSATATDTDGSIAKVEFYANTTKLGEGTLTPPSTYNFAATTGLPPGAHTLKARAYDNSGAFTDSAPATVTVLAGLPYTVDFEPGEGFSLGSLGGQFGWSVPQGAAAVVAGGFAGARSVALAPGATLARITQTFAPASGQNIIFADFYAKPVAGADITSASTFDLEGARFALLRNGTNGELRVFNGDGAGAGAWTAASFSAPLGADNQTLNWVRFTVRQDFVRKTWDIYANGALLVANLGFRDNTKTYFSSFSVLGHATVATLVDDLFVAGTNPLFTDADKDGMDDAWEVANGLNPALDDRDLDKDGDGLTNLREFMLGTRANLADTDGDGLPDGFEVANGRNPLVADTPGDSDGDGVSDAAELAAGTDPFDYYNGVAPLLAASGGNVFVRRPGTSDVLPLAALVSKVATGLPLANAPLTFSVDPTKAVLLLQSNASSGSAELNVRSDTSGIGRAWLKLNAGLATRITILARVIINTVVVREISFTLAPVVESPELALGADESLWINDGGVARAWGANALGQLGDGTVTGRSQMLRVSSLPATIRSGAFGLGHGLAVSSSGQLYSWGDNYSGQLGAGTLTSRRTPAQVTGLGTVVQVAAGDAHSLALLSDGTVLAWGANQRGQLGDGTTTARTAPAKIAALSTIVRIAAGARFSAALTASGTLWLWGSNEFGQLADSASTDRLTPAALAGITDIVALAAGRQHVIALRGDGTVLGWGGNDSGQLGLNNDRGQILPQAISISTATVGLAAGGRHTVAWGLDGVLRLWGANDAGQLGNGGTAGSLVPVTIAVTNVRALAAGSDHTVILKVDGTLQAWGLNSRGQLGATTSGNSSNVPLTVAPPTD